MTGQAIAVSRADWPQSSHSRGAYSKGAACALPLRPHCCFLCKIKFCRKGVQGSVPLADQCLDSGKAVLLATNFGTRDQRGIPAKEL
jgi:hypothetical protein